jgi:hypothetical protein
MRCAGLSQRVSLKHLSMHPLRKELLVSRLGASLGYSGAIPEDLAVVKAWAKAMSMRMQRHRGYIPVWFYFLKQPAVRLVLAPQP